MTDSPWGRRCQLPIAISRHEGVNCQTVPQIPFNNQRAEQEEYTNTARVGSMEKQVHIFKENVFRSRKRVQDGTGLKRRSEDNKMATHEHLEQHGFGD